MLGRSHVMFGLTAAVVLDGVVHISGPPLSSASPGSLLALGVEQLVILLLAQRGFIFPAQFVEKSHLVLVAVLVGCILHIAADGLTEGGVPLLWPYHKRFGFPPNPHWRFRTGDWPEYVIVYSCMLLVFLCIWQAIIQI